MLSLESLRRFPAAAANSAYAYKVKRRSDHTVVSVDEIDWLMLMAATRE
ncbi:MAG: hypothetical protein KTR20_07380 [Cellvibrionaceae bacterium]|nr:hypothetical protein [Cellvibrionaceae bacterium]